MLLFVIRMLYIMVSAGAVLAWVFSANAPQSIANHQALAFAGFLLIPLAFLLIDILIPRKRVEIMSAIYFGLLIGVLLAYLLNLALEPAFVREDKFDNPNLAKFQDGVRLLTVIILPYICISFLLQTKDQFGL